MNNLLISDSADIRGDIHPEATNSQRETEWKLINELRNNQFHSLKDSEDLYSDAHTVVPAIAHFLHDAICCLSHAHDLEAPTFGLARGARKIIFIGNAEPGIDEALEECRPVGELREVKWVAHREYGYVPEINSSTIVLA